MPWNMRDKKKFEYVWKVGDILMTTRDIPCGLDADLLKDSIIKIHSRNQGYTCTVLQPKVFDGVWCAKIRIISHDALREIHDQEWVSILEDGHKGGD